MFSFYFSVTVIVGCGFFIKGLYILGIGVIDLNYPGALYG